MTFCRTCKHWSTHHTGAGWSSCHITRTTDGNPDTYWSLAKARDMESYGAVLLTNKDFGCIQHEEDPEAMQCYPPQRHGWTVETAKKYLPHIPVKLPDGVELCRMGGRMMPFAGVWPPDGGVVEVAWSTVVSILNNPDGVLYL